MVLIGFIIVGYLLGSFPTSIIISRLVYHTDIRQHGSGNAGATNVFRTFGWKPALVVMLVDVFKGWLPTYAAGHLFPSTANGWAANGDLRMILAGFAAVLGHTFTIFAGFKGGKGVGTAAGMLIALYPIALPLCILVFVGTLVTTGIVSLGSILAAFSLPIFLFLIGKLWPTQEASTTLKTFAILVPFFILYTHRSNLKRLFQGTENRFEKAIIFKRNRNSL